jgi:RHS repeat-associated protein
VYTYDGNGKRVEKLKADGSSTIYVYDGGGNLAAEYGGQTASSGTEYVIADPLGSTRMVISGSAGTLGCPTSRQDYLPFGFDIPATVGSLRQSVTDCGTSVYGLDAGVTQKFTGKERDAESASWAAQGLDYFGARYFSAAQGRWTSPDQVNVTSDRLLSPSSTLNKYVYGANNPLRFIDPDGRDITVFYEQGFPTGHMMIAASNQQSGDFALLSVGPRRHLDPNIPLHPFEGVPGTTVFNLPRTADELRQNFAAITIQTTPEVAQQAIDAIRAGAGTGNWALLGNNCTSACSKVLMEIGILRRRDYATPFQRTNTLWNTLRAKYQPNLSSSARSDLDRNTGSLFKVNNGTDYGSPRYGMNVFDWLLLQMNAPVKACVSVSDSATGTKSTECK